MPQSSDLLSKLEQIGLPAKEALVYRALLASGGGYPSHLAEETRLNRTTVYKILLNLSVKGFVSETRKRNKLFYQTESPDRLVRYAKVQVDRANQYLETAEKLLPDFEGVYSGFANKPRVSYFEGPSGVMSIYEDMVHGKKKYEMLAFSNASAFEFIMPPHFFEKFRRAKENIGITTRGIAPDTENDRGFADRYFSNVAKGIRPDIRFVPHTVFPFKGEITLYGSAKIAMVNLNEEHLTGIILEDPTIHNMMRMVFELAWRGLGN